ncbi:MAG: hypothetical protein OHK0010_32600 [Anaerolineales bacterium]
MKKASKTFLTILISITGLCLGALAISALSNLGLPQASTHPETLDEAELTRQSELFHLRRQVGNEVWPGWGAADLPAITYNEGYAFLLDYPGQPPVGWVKVPAGIQRGEAWQVLPGKTFQGQAIHYQPLPPQIYPENFAVRVGERWVSSLQTREWMEIQLAQTVRADLPGFLRPIFPYRLFIGLLLGGDDKTISAAAHESFHAWQGFSTPHKFSEAESAARLDERYPWNDEPLAASWKEELTLLAAMLRNDDPATLPAQARRFLELRAARRQSAGLTPELIAYEQQREWLEGLARYAELEIWRQGSLPGYEPLPSTASLPDFNRYQGFATRWQQELDQMPRMYNDEGDGRFYYSGMAQAYLLDRLLPGWKERAFEKNIWLETLLAESVIGK